MTNTSVAADSAKTAEHHVPTIHVNFPTPILPPALSVADLINLGTLPRQYHHTPRTDLIPLLTVTPDIVLDVGCNTGATGELLKKTYPACRVIGVEPHKASAQKAKKLLDQVITQPLGAINWEKAGIAPHSVNVVLLPDVIEHMYNPWEALNSLKPILANGAQLLASIPNMRSLVLLHTLAGGHWPACAEGLLDATHIRFFTGAEIQKLFNGLGFSIERMVLKPIKLCEGLMHNQTPVAHVATSHLLLKNQNIMQRKELATLQFLVSASYIH